MAGQQGGVFTPGGAFGGGRAMEVLVENCAEFDVFFEVVSDAEESETT